jgi:hypothetical protein
MKNKLEKFSILTLTAVSMIAFQNCAPGEIAAKKKVDPIGLASDGTTTVGTTPTGLVVDSTGADLKPASVNYSENIMASMQNQLGVASPSAKTLAAFAAGKGQLAAKGPFNNVDTVNQPMWGAITTIAGEFCVDAISSEKTKAIGTAVAPGTRSFFNQVDFTRAPANVPETARADVIRRLALAVWGRPETATELTQVQTALTATLALPPVTGTSASLQTENAMLFVCTAMLASLDGVRN